MLLLTSIPALLFISHHQSGQCNTITTPILYLHCEADKLVPTYMSLDFYHATKGPRQIYLFSQAEHVAAIFNDRYQYGGVVQRFVQSIEQHS